MFYEQYAENMFLFLEKNKTAFKINLFCSLMQGYAVNNYSPKWTYGELNIHHFYPYSEVNTGLCIYHTSWIINLTVASFTDKICSSATEAKREAILFSLFAQRWLVLAIHFRASQSECAESSNRCVVCHLLIVSSIYALRNIGGE